MRLCPACREAFPNDEAFAVHECEGPTLPLTVSTGTLRSEDLIAAFGPVLQQLHRQRYDEIFSVTPSGTDEQSREEWQIETVVALQDALDECAPFGWYFGPIEGDGADFGFYEEYRDQ